MNPKEVEYRNELKIAGYSKEDEYFYEKDQELIAQLRAQADAVRRQAQSVNEQEAHWMRCPRCGGQLKEESIEGHVQVDRCEACDGLFLDKGALEIMLKARPHLLERILGRR